MRKENNFFALRATRKNTSYLNSKVFNKSSFINKAIEFYIDLINNPKKVMVELKKRNPELWRYINRRKFYSEGTFK